MRKFKHILHIDVESYSSVNLGECGVYAYANSPDFELLLFSYAIDDGPVTCIDFAQGEELPQEIIDMIYDRDVVKMAHNATFERITISKHLKLDKYLDPYNWWCTANRAAELGMPRSLDGAGQALGLEEDKAKMSFAGKALIRYFCVPCAPTKVNGGRTRNYYYHDIERWDVFKKYNIRDVVAEQEICRREFEYQATTDHEHLMYELDQRINDEGVAVDMKLVDAILDYTEHYIDGLNKRAMALTGLSNPNSLSQLKAWLEGRGLSLESLSKDNIDELIAEAVSKGLSDVAEVLNIRKETGKTSVAKYEAMKRAAIWDEESKSWRVHGMLMFYGAMRTGRWAGRIVQLQNLPRNKYADLDFARELVLAKDFETLELCYGNIMDVFSQLIRTAFVPTKGHRFIVADYNAIEARVIAWLADEQWKVDMFARGGKVYEETASRMFHVPVSEIGHDSEERAKGKVAELAGGYGGGVAAYKAMGADRFGWSDEEIQTLVYQWRDANEQIVKYWTTIEKSAIRAYEHKGEAVVLPHKVAFKMYRDTMFMHLPSGRCLAMKGFEYGQYKDEKRPTVTYMGESPETNKYIRLKTFGGKMVENLVQATARDCLAYAIEALMNKGYHIRFHVHDEVIVEVKEENADWCEKDITSIMAITDKWKEGLPLRAESYQCDYYLKK